MQANLPSPLLSLYLRPCISLLTRSLPTTTIRLVNDAPRSLCGHREPSYRPYPVRYTVVGRARCDLVNKDELAKARVRVGGLFRLVFDRSVSLAAAWGGLGKRVGCTLAGGVGGCGHGGRWVLVVGLSERG